MIVQGRSPLPPLSEHQFAFFLFLLLLQLPAVILEKAVEDDPWAWASATHIGDPDGGSGLWLPSVVAI